MSKPQSERPTTRPAGVPRAGVRLQVWPDTSFPQEDFAVLEGMRLKVGGIEEPCVQGVSTYLHSLPSLSEDYLNA